MFGVTSEKDFALGREGCTTTEISTEEGPMLVSMLDAKVVTATPLTTKSSIEESPMLVSMLNVEVVAATPLAPTENSREEVPMPVSTSYVEVMSTVSSTESSTQVFQN